MPVGRLLLSPTANDRVAATWKLALEREGVPYDARLGGQPSPADGEQAALAKRETTFGIRLADYPARRTTCQAVIAAGQINDNSFPSATHGLNAPFEGGEQGGT